MHTVAQSYKAISLLKPQSIATTTTGTGVDIEQYEDDAMFILDLGAQAGTTETLDVTIETSTNGTDYTTALTFGQVTGSNGDNLIAAGLLSLAGIKKVRAVATKSSTGADLISVMMLARVRIEGSTTNSVTPA